MLKKIVLKIDKNSVELNFHKRRYDLGTDEICWFSEKNEKITDQDLIKELDSASLNSEITIDNQKYKVASIGHG